MSALIAELNVYPVKSCRGIAVERWTIHERGLVRDREWMIVGDDMRFITQREQPRLALVVPALGDGWLELSAEGMSRLGVAFDARGAAVRVSVWNDVVAAFDQGDKAASWLSEFLNASVRLVRFDAQARRYCNPVYAGDSQAHTAFADAYPLLIVSQASLDDLNERLAQPLPADRFRPNIVLAGINAYDEDYITDIECGTVRLKLVKPCTRCRITTTDQATANVGVEPLLTLARYRRNDALDGVTFGMNAIVTDGFGQTIACGASLRCALSY